MEVSEQPKEKPTRRGPPPGMKRGFMRLRRDENCIQWGFRIIGGTDFNEPITIIKVTRESLAFKKGIRPGDVILKVCGTLVKDLTNEMAKMEILRAGNELDLVIERDLTKVMPTPQPKPKQRSRPAPDMDLPPTTAVNPNLQSRSFNILREALDRMGSMSPSQEGTPIVLHGSDAPQALEGPADGEYEEYVPPEIYVPPEERNNTEYPTEDYTPSDEVATEPRG